jgi:hypothetical protein
MSKIGKVKFADYQISIAKALDLVGAPARLPQFRIWVDEYMRR